MSLEPGLLEEGFVSFHYSPLIWYEVRYKRMCCLNVSWINEYLNESTNCGLCFIFTLLTSFERYPRWAFSSTYFYSFAKSVLWDLFARSRRRALSRLAWHFLGSGISSPVWDAVPPPTASPTPNQFISFLTIEFPNPLPLCMIFFSP